MLDGKNILKYNTAIPYQENKLKSICIPDLKALYFQYLQHGKEEGYNTRCKAVRGGESEARTICSHNT